MLIRWLERGGIGQFLAPDDNAAPVTENDEAKSIIWQLLAPDENFSDPKPPPLESFPPPIEHSTTETSNSSSSETPKATTTTTIPANAFGTPFYPQTPRTPATATNEKYLNNRVMSACRDTAKFFKSPQLERKNNDKFLRFCASTKPLKEPILKKMRAMIEANNFHDSYLFRVRATRMGVTAPDGYTPLMAAAYADHVVAAEMILELAKNYQSATGDDQYKDLHLDTDMYGMNPLHIAAERGNVEMTRFLCPLYKFPLPESKGSTTNNDHVPLVDLTGQTAFGRAVTSPVPKAKENKRSLEKELFSNNDLSIFGTAKPMDERMGSIQSLGLHFGTADMPGMRGYMEDAMSFQEWTLEEGSCQGPVALFCVCDGHGDNGKVSDFVASNAKEVLSNCIADYERENKDDKNLILSSQEYWSAVWEKTCLQLDCKLKEARLKEGGSTGVFALVTSQEIVVANVGDSRCILASSKPTPEGTNGDHATNKNGTDPKESESSEASAETEAAETEAPPALVAEESSSSNDQKEIAVVVTALSEDHKPTFPEEIARVKAAGFDVETIAIQEEDGTETLIHKVVKNAKEQLAVSRAFGDFDYKANKQLPEVEQAVIPLPDVVIHTRKPDSDLYLVLACDGIWDVMDNEEVIDVVQKQVEIKSKFAPEFVLPDVADALLHECLGKDSRDNLSAIVVSFQQHQQNGAEQKNGIDDTFEPKTLDFGSPK